MSEHRLREALAVLADTGALPPAVRTDVAQSWARSLERGLSPDSFEVPWACEPDTESTPIRAATSVLSDLASDLEGTPVAVLLADASGRVVARWASGRRLRTDLDGISLAPGFDYGEGSVGTNAIGAALEQGAATYISGHEHFAEALTAMACGAAPFSDPSTGLVLGAVDLTCRVGDANPLLLAFARRAARDVAARLAGAMGADDQALWQHFLDARRGAKGPVVVVSPRRMLLNAAADHMVHPAEHAAIWQHARRCIGAAPTEPTPGPRRSRLGLASGTEVEATCEPLWDGGEVLGAVLRFERRAEQGTAASLTATEQSVAALVVEGLTNRQVAEKLFMSRFTVDSHLRSIYRKAGVASRVELARTL